MALFLRTERTYCFTAVRDQTRRLLKRFLEVVLESLVLVLFGAQLHEFACEDGEDLASGWLSFATLVFKWRRSFFLSRTPYLLPDPR